MLAVGFTLIFGVARILNLAHGSFYALGAYSAYVLTSHAASAAAAGGAAVGAAGGGVRRGRSSACWSGRCAVPARRADDHARVALVVEQALFLTFGSEYRNVPAFVDTKFTIGGVDIGGQRLLALGVERGTLIGALWLFIQRTRLGSAILAVSQDPEAAQYMGIPERPHLLAS